MSRRKESFRCGHCGRTFNRSYLHHNNIWCNNCNFYFCNECVPGQQGICPKCGRKNWNRVTDVFTFSFFVGTGMLFFWIFWLVIFLSGYNRGLMVISYGFLALAGILYLIAYVFYIRIRKLYQKHKDYLLRLPRGEIPREKRPVNPDRGDIKKEESSIEHKFPTPEDFGLSGMWNEIALSRDEWRKRCREESSIFLILSVLCVIGSIVLFYLKILCGEGFFLIIFALTFAVAGVSENIRGIKDSPRYVRIELKTVGIKRIHDLISVFLAERSIKYTHEIVKPDRKYQYLLPEGIVIKLFYKENRSAYPQQGQKRLQIHYDSTNYERVRELQMGMDKYFGREDIIFQYV